MNMDLNCERLFRDDAVMEGVAVADCDLLDLSFPGCRLFGEIYLPDGSYLGKRPCVCLLHGFPGSVVNDDLAQALRRMGCVVIRLFQRGAWGSLGCYSFTNNIHDAVSVVKWLRKEGAERYPVDPDRIFLIGHSVGGQTAWNAARQLPELLGAALLAPMDLGRLWKNGEISRIEELLPLGQEILREEKPGAWLEDLREHWTDLWFCADPLPCADQNILLVGAEMDHVAPPDEMILPLWKQLQSLPERGVRKYIRLQAGHSFCSCRLRLIEIVGHWIAESCEQAAKGLPGI